MLPGFRQAVVPSKIWVNQGRLGILAEITASTLLASEMFYE
jgi:hypothetical protein